MWLQASNDHDAKKVGRQYRHLEDQAMRAYSPHEMSTHDKN